MLKKVLIVLLMWTGISKVLAQDKKNQWIDSVFQTLDAEEKIGQLFVIPVSSYNKKNEIENLFSDINRHHPGGIIVTGGGPVGTVKLINRLQQQSKIPILVLIDAENGPGNVLDSLIQFPKPLALGAIANDSLIFSLGKEIARQMKLLGINMNLAPNADIDLITRYPFNFYGTDKLAVSSKTISLVNGLQQNGVIAVAKHASASSGESDSKEESYDFTNNQLDTLTFYPFDQLIKSGIKGINTSHLHFSTLDKKKAIPASVSQLFVSDVLKKQLGFKGLTITEIPYIQSISGKAKTESEKLAFEVGNDLLINPTDLGDAVKKIQSALKRNAALQLQLDNSVKRILAAKYDVGLNHSKALNTDNLIDHINTAKARTFDYDLTTASITVARNQSELIPIKTLDSKRFASLRIGQGDKATFQEYLNNYTHFDLFDVLDQSEANSIEKQLSNYDVLVVSLYSLKPVEINSWVQWLNKIIGQQTTIVVSFGNPYDLEGL
ncbi:MAG: glycoside hydrolase family 3 N-terminal domain-containing protein, partial [Cyclobacteriaceae bacterium]